MNNETLKRNHDDKKHILIENSNHSVKRGLLKKILEKSRSFIGKRKSRKSDSQGTQRGGENNNMKNSNCCIWYWQYEVHII